MTKEVQPPILLEPTQTSIYFNFSSYSKSNESLDLQTIEVINLNNRDKQPRAFQIRANESHRPLWSEKYPQDRSYNDQRISSIVFKTNGEEITISQPDPYTPKRYPFERGYKGNSYEHKIVVDPRSAAQIEIVKDQKVPDYSHMYLPLLQEAKAPLIFTTTQPEDLEVSVVIVGMYLPSETFKNEHINVWLLQRPDNSPVSMVSIAWCPKGEKPSHHLGGGG